MYIYDTIDAMHACKIRSIDYLFLQEHALLGLRIARCRILEGLRGVTQFPHARSNVRTRWIRGSRRATGQRQTCDQRRYASQSSSSRDVSRCCGAERGKVVTDDWTLCPIGKLIQLLSKVIKLFAKNWYHDRCHLPWNHNTALASFQPNTKHQIK